MGIDIGIDATMFVKDQESPKIRLRGAVLEAEIILVNYRGAVFFDELLHVRIIHEPECVGWREQAIDEIIQIDRKRNTVGEVGKPDRTGNETRFIHSPQRRSMLWNAKAFLRKHPVEGMAKKMLCQIADDFETSIGKINRQVFQQGFSLMFVAGFRRIMFCRATLGR